MLILKLVLLGSLGAADSPLLLRQALADLQAGRLEPAEQKLELMVRQQPDLAAAHHYLGVTRFRLGRLPGARQALEQAVRRDPRLAGAWKALGAVYAAESNFRLAEEPFRKACDLDPREPEACYYLGRNHYELSQFDAAVATYEKALPFDPMPWRVHNGVAQALAALGRAREAERRFRLAVETYRGRGRPDENPSIDLGAFLFQQGRLEEALLELEQVVAASPASPRARFEFARVLLTRNRLEEAARHLQASLQLEPDRWAVHLLLGKIYYRLGRPEEAERHMRIGEKGAITAPLR